MRKGSNPPMLAWLKDNFRAPYHQIQAMFIPERQQIEKLYKKVIGCELDLQNPTTFNEKIIYLSLFYRPKAFPALVDKYEVREYVTRKGCAWTLNELLGLYERVEDIDLAALPNAFVLKLTNGSGWNIICADKATMDWDRELDKLKKWSKSNYYWFGREWIYKDIRPRIVAEKFLDDPIYPSMTDFKFHCFEGVPHFVTVDMDRASLHKRNTYDMDWNLLPFGYGFPTSPQVTDRPANFEEMTAVAKTLAQDFFFCRVDLYSIRRRTVFGELTFLPGNGLLKFEPQEYDEYWGAKMNLANLKNYP
jgi:hypothetical protein